MPIKLGKTKRQMKNIDLVTLLAKSSLASCIRENAGKVTRVTVSMKKVRGSLAIF
jgi:hypothetical protein